MLRKGVSIVGGILGVVLGMVVVEVIDQRIAKEFYILTFLFLPLLILILLNLLSRNRNLPMLVKSFGFMMMVWSMVKIIILPMKVTILGFRRFPWIMGGITFLLLFIFLFIVRLEKLGKSISIAFGVAIMMGVLVPSIIFDFNMIYDKEQAIESEVRVQEVIHSYGEQAGLLRLNREDFENYKIYIKVEGNTKSLQPGDKILLKMHSGVLGIPWCQGETIQATYGAE